MKTTRLDGSARIYSDSLLILSFVKFGMGPDKSLGKIGPLHVFYYGLELQSIAAALALLGVRFTARYQNEVDSNRPFTPVEVDTVVPSFHM